MNSAVTIERSRGASAEAAPHVRFENSDSHEDEEARLRRGSVSRDLRNTIAIRGIIGRNAVTQGYATNRGFLRSQSEASIFRPEPDFSKESANDNPSVTLWESGYTTLSRAKSTSSVISGLNDDVLRAGWRRNEPGPYWEQAHELEPDRQAVVSFNDGEGDGFDVDELDLENPSTDSSAPFPSDLADLMNGDDAVNYSSEVEDQVGDLPAVLSAASFPSSQRQLSKTQSMPIGGAFGTRPEQPRFYRHFDENFMRMDVPF